MKRQALTPNFASLAVQSYDRTFRAVFHQAGEEIDRLQRINGAMRVLEDRLLDPAVIQNMEVNQQVTLLEILTRNQQTAIRNVMGFGTMFRNIRSLVSTHDGLLDAAGQSLQGEQDDLEVTGRLLEHDEDDFNYEVE